MEIGTQLPIFFFFLRDFIFKKNFILKTSNLIAWKLIRYSLFNPLSYWGLLKLPYKILAIITQLTQTLLIIP